MIKMFRIKVVKVINTTRRDNWHGFVLTLPKIIADMLQLTGNEKFEVWVDVEKKIIQYKLVGDERK